MANLKITNTMIQIQNILIKDEVGKSRTLALMPKGTPDSSKVIPESAMSGDIEIRKSKGYVKVSLVAG